MIQIIFTIHCDGFIKKKQFRFCKNHEKNLYIIYEITKESIQKNSTLNLEQILIIFCFHIVNQLRKNTVTEIIQKNLVEEVFRFQNIACWKKDVSSIKMEVIVDRMPKKIFELSLIRNEYASLTESQVLRSS